MDEQGASVAGDFQIIPWDDEGVAVIEAAGKELRTMLEAVLRGVLALTVPEPASPADPETRAAPIRGEGDDAASLIADLTEDLLAQIDDAGAGSLSVALDGVVRRDDGGYVAWGYLETTARAATRVATVELQEEPVIEEEPSRMRARLRLVRHQGR